MYAPIALNDFASPSSHDSWLATVPSLIARRYSSSFHQAIGLGNDKDAAGRSCHRERGRIAPTPRATTSTVVMANPGAERAHVAEILSEDIQMRSNRIGHDVAERHEDRRQRPMMPVAPAAVRRTLR
jgi:hypothetical protein